MTDSRGGATAALVRKLRRRDNVSADEEAVLAGAVAEVLTLAPKEDLVREGDRPSHSCLLVEGFAARYKVLGEGGRQITAVHVPGDFVDLHSYLLRPMDHGVTTLTACRVANVPHSALTRISETHPHLMRLLWLLTLLDGAIHREWLVAMGRRSALGHLAHLICEIYTQLWVVDLASDRSFLFPVTQADLADMLGLSSVHVNRTLQEMRSSGLISWQGANVKILDWERLREVGEFDETYLNLVHEPR